MRASARVSVTVVTSFGDVTSTRTSKPIRTSLVTVPAWLPGVSIVRSTMSWGRTSWPRNVVTVHDDVANVDADPQPNALIGATLGFACGEIALDVERANADKHIAFGYGPHVCIGKRVAQIQLQEAYRQILARFPNATWTGGRSKPESSLLTSAGRDKTCWHCVIISQMTTFGV